MKVAEWWANEDGGVFCSNCGLFFDDIYESAPKICERCHCTMIDNMDAMVWRNGRLSLEDIEYVDESEYPEWLLELRKNEETFKQDTLNNSTEKIVFPDDIEKLIKEAERVIMTPLYLL